MPAAEARVQTERAPRYLVQLCQHVTRIYAKGPVMRHQRHRQRHGDAPQRPEMPPLVECSETQGTISFGLGTITMQASQGALLLHAEAADSERLQQMQEMLTANLKRFGRRDHIAVDWKRPEAAASNTDPVADTIAERKLSAG